MNKTYRLIFNEHTNTWVAVTEFAKARGKRAAGAVLLAAAALLSVASLAGPAWAQTAPPANQLPTGGQVVAGQAAIAQSANALTVTQTTARAAIDWQTFNLGSAASVNFVQPSSSAAVLNRVLDPNPSQIFGRISSNGQVFLTNPSGIYFGATANVNVGALTATTHSISNADFMAGNLRFTRDGATGSVINAGSLTAKLGGYVALLAPEVRNKGTVVAQMGTVVLAAGEAYSLQFDGSNTLADIQVSKASIATLVDNGHAVQAPGGLIILSAQAASRLQGGVVKNTGALEATGLVAHGGTIRLEASDSIELAGNLSANAAPGSTGQGGRITAIADLGNPKSQTQLSASISARGGDLGGNGGFVETSANQLQVGEATRVDTRAPQGKTGTWLLDPTDFTIAAGTGPSTTSSIGATTLQNALSTSDVSIATQAAGTDAGNINVNAPVSWSANKLTLTAHNDINVNAVMTVSGTAALDLLAGSEKVNMGMAPNFGGFTGRVDWSSSGNLNMRVGGATRNFTVITSLGSQGDEANPGVNTLQGIANSTSLGGYYVLGRNIDASATSGWNTGAGFVPIGSSSASFTGGFDGLGHTVSGLTINRPVGTFAVGLFGRTDGAGAYVRNVGLSSPTITGNTRVGALVGQAVNGASLSNVFATNVNVTATSGSVGAIGGIVSGSIRNAYSSGSVAATGSSAGGVAGQALSGMIDVYSSASVQGNTGVGGLAGTASGDITNGRATGSLTVSGVAGDKVGGLVGDVTGPAIITNSSSSATSISGAGYVGGLVGGSSTGQSITITGSTSAATTIAGTGDNVGGLVGGTTGAVNLSGNTMSANVVSGASFVGGMIGQAGTGTITGVFNGTSVTGTGSHVGGLVGKTAGSITNSRSNATVSTAAYNPSTSTPTNIGGLVGAGVSISDSQATGSVTNGEAVGGLAGSATGAITNSWASGNVVAQGLAGGLVGNSSGNISSSNASGSVAGSNLSLSGRGQYVGGLAGKNSATISNSYASGAVSGRNYVGGLVGEGNVISGSYATGNVTWTDVGFAIGGLAGLASGAVSNSYATGNLQASASFGAVNVGGLVGAASGSVTRSYATGNLTGPLTQAGGLVGLAAGAVTNSYATGNLASTAASTNDGTNIGGLVGTAGAAANISTSYANGTVSGRAGKTGGLVGARDLASTITASYWNTSTSGQSVGVGDSGSQAGTAGLTTAQMQAQASYTPSGSGAGQWDFVNVWQVTAGVAAPTLRGLPVPPGLQTGASNGASSVTTGSTNANVVIPFFVFSSAGNNLGGGFGSSSFGSIGSGTGASAGGAGSTVFVGGSISSSDDD